MKKSVSGFTIVELLIVIVVIAILAAISLVAYNGVQERSNISAINSSLNQINKSILSFHAVNGTYPDTGNTWINQASGKDTFIPGLVPTFVSELSRPPQILGTPVIYYRSNGIDYKLLYLYPSTQTIPSSVASNAAVSSIIDPIRPTRGWGYWSSEGANF